MKKNGLLLCILCVILMCLCCSCGFFGDQEYICEVDAVESIQIIRLDEYVEGEYRYEYTILSQISDTEVFVERLNEVKHSVNWGEPSTMKVQYIVIRIEYRNGDFDMIHSAAQYFNRSGENHTGFFFFDEEQFNSLISDYLAQ